MAEQHSQRNEVASGPANNHAGAPGWLGRLALRLVKANGRTRVRWLAGQGPLYIQKPFYPEGEVCHLYLLHPPGGVVGGDRLEISLDLKADAKAVVTTPAATKIYRSAGPRAELIQEFQLAEGASLEWLPQETILSGGCRVNARTCVYLAPGARYIGWELTCLGRAASGDLFAEGEVNQRVSLYRCTGAEVAEPLLLECNRWRAGDHLLSARWGLAGRMVCGTLYATPADIEILEMVRRVLPAATETGELLHAMTLVNGVLVARVLAADSESARAWMQSVWERIRPLLVGRKACRPRIWDT
ncbi:MAG: urease accessory protein UreD [Gammaproteobacteria bacterium]|nr:urease accessory protein UreD [Gammaproteobacteria bacterium]